MVGFGLNEAAAPAGSPDALSETLPVKPPFGVTVTPYVVGLPGLTVWLEGDAATEKSGEAASGEPLKLPMRVCQLKMPLAARYSFVYQKVQSSLGIDVMLCNRPSASRPPVCEPVPAIRAPSPWASTPAGRWRAGRRSGSGIEALLEALKPSAMLPLPSMAALPIQR